MSEPTPKPSNADIVGLLQAGDAAAAERAARARTDQDPSDSQGLVLLAISLSMLSRFQEAADIYRKLTEVEPEETSHYHNLGTSLRETGDLAGAEEKYRQGLSINPYDPPALASLGTLRWQQGDAVETRQLMQAAFQLDQGLPEARIYGALAAHECADTETAKQLLQGSEDWPYLGHVFEPDLATALMQVERTDDAEQRLRNLMAHPEASGVARLRLASQLERVNRIEEAEALLADAQLGPEDREEELGLRAALAQRGGKHQEAVTLYRSMLESAGKKATKAPAWFALAKACDSMKDVAGAMEALTTAHDIQMAQAAKLVPELMAADSNPLSITSYPVNKDAHERWIVDPSAPSAQDSPIFIVGFPRSGTTLLEQMLDAHPGLRSMDERAFLQDVIARMQESGERQYPEDLDKLEAEDLETLRKTYWNCVRNVVDLKPGERLVDKNPLNILRLPMIHRIFPNARIVLALRHPCDVILSNYMQSFRAPAFQVLCSTLDRLSRGYANAMDFWVRHVALFKPAVLELRYEDLLEDVVAQTRRIAEHLELSDAKALEKFQEHARAKGFISTPSYAQVVEPLNKKAVGRWQRYREYLEPVLPALEPAMKRWGYES
ncbi:sulfotransferase [Dokdonella sp.]|uniref:tetratricopeptide repeat-containing sulfotransferase family protein n=1 Tax=Dokdonella sp. TaxID=2291710 RepID=UPI003526EB73